jgi:hypothetical protein
VKFACADRNTSRDNHKGLGTLSVFDIARSGGYGEVECQAMPELASLLALNAGDSFIGCGIGWFLLFLVTTHPKCTFAGVRVVTTCYDIAVQARHQLSLSFPIFEHRVHLLLGAFLSLAAQMEIDFTRLLVAFISDILLQEQLHQELVQLILRRCPALC